MNRQTVLTLLGAVVLFALVSQSSAAKGDRAAFDVKDADSKEENGRRGPFGRHGGFDFRKEIQTIFEKYSVDPKIRENILNDIKDRMDAIHKEKGGFRKRGQQKDKTGGQAATTKA